MRTTELKLGIVGLDGHGPVFADIANRNSPGQDYGMRVVAAMPVDSVMISKEQLRANITKTKNLGIQILESPEDLAKGVDGILILHDDGSMHYDLVKLFCDKGKPLFVDKPLEVSTEKASRLMELCRKAHCPVFSASSLRFTLEIQKVLENAAGGSIISALAYAPYVLKPTMPGWIYYGIHAVEPLYALMGTGCQKVQCLNSASGPIAIGTWKDGRMGIARATAKSYHGYGFTVWREKSTEVAAVDSGRIYQEMLKTIKRFFETGLTPVPLEESVEVIAFMEAANASMAKGGREMPAFPSGSKKSV